MAKQRNPNGAGSYSKRKDGRYMWRQKIDGKERTLYANSLKELQEKVKQTADLPITSNKLTVAEWFDKWLEAYIKPLKKQATYDQYRIMYEQHIKPQIGHRKLSGIKSYDVQSVIAKMHERKLSHNSMKRVRSIINLAMTKAVDDKLISTNPVVKIEIPTKQAKPIKVLQVEELIKLFKAMERSRWIWSIRFMLVTGLRRGELLALRWTDIDFKAKRLTVDKSNSLTGLGETKSAKVRYVPLSDKAINILHNQKRMLAKEFNPSLHNEDLKKVALVFPSKNGTMMRPDSYYTMLRRFAEKAGIKASPHSLRHTFVYFTRHTLSLKDLQAVLGHDESTTTLDLYGDLINERTIETAQQIDSVFAKVEEEMTRIEEEKQKKKDGKMGKVIEFRGRG